MAEASESSMPAASGNGRLLGLDYGSKTVGVAVSDPLFLTSLPVETIFRDREGKLRATLARIRELAGQYDIARVVVGLPLNMDGSEGERCEKTRRFAAQVEKRLGLSVVLMDERLTTKEADEILSESGVAPEKRKAHIDTVAAAVILKEYMQNPQLGVLLEPEGEPAPE